MIHTSNYFKADLTHSLVKPVVAGGLLLGYKYFVNKGAYNNSLMLHLPAAGIVAGATAAARIGIGLIPSPSSEGLRSIEHMALQPVMTGALYALGRKMIQNSDNMLMDGVHGALACVGSSYLETPIDKFFKV